MTDVAVIGAGLAGLSCAIELARCGLDVTVLEAAPRAGGRTRSMHDPASGMRIDNGPHLLVGAYHATQRFLHDCGLADRVHWQHSLRLPLWHPHRGHFRLAPTPELPLPWALAAALPRMPGHEWRDLPALLRLRHSKPKWHETAAAWFDRLRLPSALVQDILVPLCLGAMNESPQTANASSLAQVLRLSFASHAHARLGWFTAPLDEALVTPLLQHARRLGVRFRLRTRIVAVGGHIHAMHAIDRHGVRHPCRLIVRTDPPRDVASNPITNVHLWFERELRLPDAIIGGIGTTGHWFFDTGRLWHRPSAASHLAVVISAAPPTDRRRLVRTVCNEIGQMLDRKRMPEPVHARIVCERRATILVRSRSASALRPGVVDAYEHPEPGELPATIETAIRRGMDAARRARMLLTE